MPQTRGSHLKAGMLPRLLSTALLCFLLPSAIPAVAAVPPAGLDPLNQIPVPEPPNLYQFVKNKQAAIKLGKAFFWDMQAGSDGVTACATCHFSAGADNRLKNSVNPGTRGGDTTFQVKGPNQTLNPASYPTPGGDFPFHVRVNPDYQNSAILHDVNDIVGSQGVTRNQFTGITPGSAVDNGTPLLDPIFNTDLNANDVGLNTRRVTARNTPSVINAIFNFNNFWDGRAYFRFNGVNPFGQLDPTAGVWFNENGTLVKQPISIPFASLASQAVGPPLDDTEMSYTGRTFPDLGRKLLNLTPLGQQVVHPGDSVLGHLSLAVLQPNGKMGGENGLSVSYRRMIQDAFQDTFWNNSTDLVAGNFNQMEANFSLFWGLAIQLYEATLVSDQTRFDQWLGDVPNALTQQEQDGFTLFNGAAGCTVCHTGSELTSASVTAGAYVTNTNHLLIEQMAVLSGADGIYDLGYNNTSVCRTTEDIARGGNSPKPNPLNANQPFPLSFSALSELQATGHLGFDATLFQGGTPLAPILPAPLPSDYPITNNGAFKVPSLRNLDLTAPYFHNGGTMTLEDVVDFYTRGGNFPFLNQDDLDIAMTGVPALQDNKGPKMAALVAFLKTLTDERVRSESAPFDHPELRVPNGEEWIHIPAKDEFGNAAPAIPLTLGPVLSPTHLSSQTIGGTTELGTTIQVSLNGGAPVAAALGHGTWSILLEGLAEGTNHFVITATDALNNTAVLNGVIDVDNTTPILTLDAVTSPTTETSQVLSGTVQVGIIPLILVGSGATAGPVTISGTTWSATLVGLVNGDNPVTIVAIDAADNVTIQTANVVFGAAEGDCDGTGTVDQADALKALRVATGLIAPTPLELAHGDVAPLVNGVPTQDQDIDLADALLILRKAEGHETF